MNADVVARERPIVIGERSGEVDLDSPRQLGTLGQRSIDGLEQEDV